MHSLCKSKHMYIHVGYIMFWPCHWRCHRTGPNRIEPIESLTVNWLIENICSLAAHARPIESQSIWSVLKFNRFKRYFRISMLYTSTRPFTFYWKHLVLRFKCICHIYSQDPRICQPNELHQYIKRGENGTGHIIMKLNQYNQYSRDVWMWWAISQSKLKSKNTLIARSRRKPSNPVETNEFTKGEREKKMATKTWKMKLCRFELYTIIRNKVESNL